MTGNNPTGAPTAGTTPEIEELRAQLHEARCQVDAEHNARNATYDQLVRLREQLLVAQEALGAERTRNASRIERLDRFRIRAWLLVLLINLAVAALVTV